MNLREMIAKANTLRPKIKATHVVFEGTKIPFTLRRLSYHEAEKLRLSIVGPSGIDSDLMRGGSSRTIALMIVDEAGDPMFTAAEVAEWDDGLIQLIVTECNAFNATSKNAVETEVKNSTATSDAVH